MLSLSEKLETESRLGLLRTTPAEAADVEENGGESADWALIRPELSIMAAEGSWSNEMARLLCIPAPAHVRVVLRRRSRL